MKYIITMGICVAIAACMSSINNNQMEIIEEAITGREESKEDTPYAALVQFYAAFNNGDFDLMARNWANNEEIAMDNPLGGINRGWPEIKAVYRRIFEGPAEVYVEFHDFTIHESVDMFYAVGRERGYFEINGERIELAIRTSRIFQKIEGTWRQVHHHGSIEDPELLDTYQQLVKK